MNPFTILEIQLSVIIENLANAFGGNHDIKVKKDEDYYRLNIIIDTEQIGSISINGKGLDEIEYFQELLNIMQKYLSEKLKDGKYY